MSVYKNRLELYGDVFLLVMLMVAACMYFGDPEEEPDYAKMNGIMMATMVIAFMFGPVIRFTRVLKNQTLNRLVMWGAIIGVYFAISLFLGEEMGPDESKRWIPVVAIGVIMGFTICSAVYQRHMRKKDGKIIPKESEDGDH